MLVLILNASLQERINYSLASIIWIVLLTELFFKLATVCKPTLSIPSSINIRSTNTTKTRIYDFFLEDKSFFFEKKKKHFVQFPDYLTKIWSEAPLMLIIIMRSIIPRKHNLYLARHVTIFTTVAISESCQIACWAGRLLRTHVPGVTYFKVDSRKYAACLHGQEEFKNGCAHCCAWGTSDGIDRWDWWILHGQIF